MLILQVRSENWGIGLAWPFVSVDCGVRRRIGNRLAWPFVFNLACGRGRRNMRGHAEAAGHRTGCDKIKKYVYGYCGRDRSEHERIAPTAKSIELTVRAKVCGRGLKIGDSLAVNGCWPDGGEVVAAQEDAKLSSTRFAEGNLEAHTVIYNLPGRGSRW